VSLAFSLRLLLLDVLGLNALFRFLNRKKILILMYHGICDDGFTLLKGYDERHIPASLFRKHLDYLRRKGYSFVSMSELVEIIRGQNEAKKIVALTFDDGFRNVVENAYPLLKEFQAKGCYYLITDLIGTDRLVWTDYIETVVRNSPKGVFELTYKGDKIRYRLDTKASYESAMKDIKAKLRKLSDKDRNEHMRQFENRETGNIPKEFLFAQWEQIGSLDKNVLEIGSHTKTHPNCDRLSSEKEFEEELHDSRMEIEKRIGIPVRHFCYPAGAFNSEIIGRLKGYGYGSAVTTQPGLNDEDADLFSLKRVYVDESFLWFKATTSGSYYAAQRFKSFVKKTLGGGR